LHVKLLQSLWRFPRFDAKSGGTPGTGAGKDVFGFTNCGKRFCITGQSVLFIPGDMIVTMTRYDS
jgi:hypothetical protein